MSLWGLGHLEKPGWLLHLASWSGEDCLSPENNFRREFPQTPKKTGVITNPRI